MRSSEITIADFWTRVEEAPNGCWIYRGAIRANSDGGYFGSYHGISAHRIAAIIYLGTRVGIVKRSCKNPYCVRKEHFSSVGFEYRRAEYDPFTGKRIEISNPREHPVYKRLIDIKRQGTPFTVSFLARANEVSETVIRSCLRVLTVDCILEDRKYYVDNKLEIPMKPQFKVETYEPINTQSIPPVTVEPEVQTA